MKLINLFKTHRAEKITAIIFLVITFGMLSGLFLNARSVASCFLTDYRTTVLPGTPVADRVRGAANSLERAVNDDIQFRDKYVNIYGWIQSTMGKRIIADAGYGQLYKTKYNQITFAVSKQDVSEPVESMHRLNKELNKHGIPLLYVQAPFKLPPDEQQLPDDVKDYANENVDNFLKGLSAEGIDYLDLREDYWSKGLNQNQLFFNTDHHWTINGAFLGYQEIAAKLNQSYGFDIADQYMDLDSYEQQLYKDFYIGSMGRRVGKAFGGTDDFTLITPKFDTDYTVYELDYGEEKIYKGSFRDAVLTNSYLDEKAPLDTNRYAAYHGDNAELRFVNHNVKNGKVLIIKDSFGLPVYCFLSTGIHEVRALDVRLFKDSVAEYAEKYDPDVVIILYNGDCFGGSMFDFDAK
jgi:hypothetical protein